MLKVEQLEKRYDGRPVVDKLSFHVRRGECFALLGPNGAGKTTTLKLALGLVAPDGGRITLVGEPVPARAREARARVGVVPQFDNLDPDFTVAENLVVWGRYFGLDGKLLRSKVPYWLEFAGLSGRENAKVGELSGGMKRRLTLARALVNDPDILFLDEPTTGLDPQARHLIWQRLRQLMQQGKTLVLTSHFMDEAERLATRLAVLDNGQLIAEGSPRSLIERHIEPDVVEIYGDNAVPWARGVTLDDVRLEITGETAFFYGEGLVGLEERLDAEGLRYVRRPANLEDVFLKLTGRELRD
ncbi:ATP-binding cassette domain-containing protein [Crenobacter cavernae]|uniref:ATP-binding cassette domain-containing protein n=1 Tax=Crenobacter cavernae TaxID=2290923 RepID=A0A345Y8J0_9NEIS|nr:ATP-binding cassette domain-containing protein [Crenobacter cavernae]AXK40242.1 ATP-binding cassette domain-containing protein [Crenobacter cavernae]RXZ42798.1 ATP-binding cassette domain-containing protein [Crenobacter cavernae]